MELDLVSIIIPTFNRAYCIRHTVDSVVAQTHANWEVLIVDDGSTDDTRQVIASTYSHDPRIRYLYQSNGGVSHARNTGIAEARGEFIAFLDSDDTWKPWKLAVQLACLAGRPEIGMIWTDMEAVDSKGNIIDARHLKTMYSAYQYFQRDTLFESSALLGDIAADAPDPGAKVYYGDIYTAMIMGNLVHTSTVLLRRDRLDKVVAFDEDLKLSGEDYDFHLRTCKWGPVALIDVASIQYQKGFTDQLTKHGGAIANNFLTTVQRAIEDDTSNRFPPEAVRQVLAHAHAWVAEEEFKVDHDLATRQHALQSLSQHPLQPRLVALVGLTLIPQFARRSVLNKVHRLKRHDTI